ncbi:MAG TPA: hypothetical protein VLD65_00565 [Anaerolineales bacterium]|nr:hypothetical protein [Anaerolineales bacterium]
MTTSFESLLTYCLVALGDSDASTWSRTDVIWPWCNEAMLAFPILRPMQDDHTVAGAATHVISLPTDFREPISVEYPISQDPPQYLTRKNRFDPGFYEAETYYDIERDYSSSTGWSLWTSKLLAVGVHIKTNYLATHKTDCIDDPASLITVPDEYVHILVAYVVAKGYRERLGVYMQDPTAHMTIITQMTNMVLQAEKRYSELISSAMAKLIDSRTSPHMEVDKFDRVY